MSDESGGFCGCLVEIVILVVVGLIVWGLIFGVTVDGQTYNCSSCNCSEGVVIQPKPRSVQREVPRPRPSRVREVNVEDLQFEQDDLILIQRTDDAGPPADAEWE